MTNVQHSDEYRRLVGFIDVADYFHREYQFGHLNYILNDPDAHHDENLKRAYNEFNSMFVFEATDYKDFRNLYLHDVPPEERARVKRRKLAETVKRLVESFPQAVSKTFVEVLLEEVNAVYDIVPFQMAVRSIIVTQSKLPPICEVLQEAGKTQHLYDRVMTMMLDARRVNEQFKEILVSRGLSTKTIYDDDDEQEDETATETVQNTARHDDEQENRAEEFG